MVNGVWKNWLNGSTWGENKPPDRKMESEQKLVLHVRRQAQAVRDARRKCHLVTDRVSGLHAGLDFFVDAKVFVWFRVFVRVA